jgi:glycosyltransferase involved in cell wall biosynthesis
MSKKLLIFIPAYNNERHIEQVLDLIPFDEIIEKINYYEVLVSDDNSVDFTSKIVENYQKINPDKNIKLISQNKNLGYGGNQKFVYNYAVANSFDIVIMLHGDLQYSPLLITKVVEPIISENFDCVLGSRMIDKKSALKGKMPLYKFFGNIGLTFVQNILLGQKLSEYHTGLRAYRVEALKLIPFNYNNNGFLFDTDILIQITDNKMSIHEISIPTHYGTEYCNVNVIKYGLEVFFATIFSRLQKLKIINLKKFDYKIFRNNSK